MQENNTKQGSLILENCNRLILSGINDVTAFCESAITLETSLGILEIRGEELKIKTFNTESGEMLVIGYIYALAYKKYNQSKSFINKVFK